MRRNKVWLIAIIFGIMVLTTVCYITSMKNAQVSYANGRVVKHEINSDNLLPDINYNNMHIYGEYI